MGLRSKVKVTTGSNDLGKHFSALYPQFIRKSLSEHMIGTIVRSVQLLCILQLGI